MERALGKVVVEMVQESTEEQVAGLQHLPLLVARHGRGWISP